MAASRAAAAQAGLMVGNSPRDSSVAVELCVDHGLDALGLLGERAGRLVLLLLLLLQHSQAGCGRIELRAASASGSAGLKSSSAESNSSACPSPPRSVVKSELRA